MNHSKVGEKIKALRLESGISQDELAESTKLSVRTIQRIENSKTEPRGDSLKRIAGVLNIKVEELTSNNESETGSGNMKEDRSALILLNVSAFGYLIYPFLGIVFPMMLWIFYKDKVIGANETGKKVMKYQLGWCIILFAIYIYLIVTKVNHGHYIFSSQTAILFIAGTYVINAIIILLHIFKLSSAKKLESLFR